MRRVRSSVPGSVFRLGFAVRGLRARLVAGAVLAAVVAGFALAPNASAVILARNPVPIGSFGPDGTSATTFPAGSLRQLAFSQANNKLFALKSVAGASQIHSYDVPGLAPSGGAFPLSVVNPGADSDIEVDNTGGAGANSLYYSSENTNAVTPDIYGFDAGGVALAGFPIAAAAPSDICGLGVDPSGSLWATNFSNAVPVGGSAGQNRGVHRYNTAGVSQQQVNTAALGGPCRVSFDSNGDMYIAVIAGPGNTGVWKYAAPGYTSPTRIDTTVTPNVVRAVEVDAVNHRVYVVHSSGSTSDVSVYDTAGTLLYQFGTSIAGRSFRGIAIDYDTDVAYVSDLGTNKIYAFAATQVVPDASGAPTAATNVTDTTAALGATVTDNSFMPTSWRIEFSKNGINWATAATGATAGNTTNGPVSANVTGLLPNTLYRYRIITSKGSGSPDVVSAEATFLTDSVAPTIVNTTTDSVLDTSARLVGYVNPNSTPTTYRFEYGTSAGNYPNRIPTPNGSLGSGPNPVQAAQELHGLQPNTTYHYRLIAVSATQGTTTGPDKTFTTRNEPLPVRVPEMVSPTDKEAGAVRGFNGVPPINYVVAPDGNSVVYMMTRGPVDALVPDQPMYLGTRSSGGWQSEELIPAGPFTPMPDTNAISSQIDFVSDDLSCSIIRTAVPLTEDAPEAVRNKNGGYLFRRDANGDITLLTPLVPTSPEDLTVSGGWFEIAGASQDCRHVVFASPYRYAGMGDSGIYRSDNGAISEIGILPGGAPRTSLEVARIGSNSYATAGGGRKNAVSGDTSRVFFTDVVAGIDTLFVREGTTTTKVSASKTATPAANATFEIASTTGDKVAFLANYGLTATSSVAGPQSTSCRIATLEDSPSQSCALYLYDVVNDTLTDISADLNPADTNGAMAAGVVAASDDLSRIYFVAQGQVGGVGRTYNSNVASDEVNLFLWDSTGGSPSVRFIAGLTTASLRKAGPRGTLLVHNSTVGWMSHATPNGDTLVFQAAGNVVGYDSGPFPQAYHYSLQTGELSCVSCRRDGERSLGPDPLVDAIWPILNSSTREGWQSGTLTDDGQRVFFMSRDVLADGAVADNENIYEWDRGVVRLLATGSRAIKAFYNQVFPTFVGASSDGRDVFVRTTSSLVAGDTDGELDLYDLRVGGGFPEPDPPPAPCAALQGACQTGGSDTVSTDTKTSSSSGDGNATGEGRTTLSLRQPSARARAEAALSGRLRVSVETSSAGSLSLIAKARLGKRVQRVAGASKRVSGAGVTRVDLRLSRAAKRRLGSGKRLRLTVEVRQSGARMRTATVTLKRGERS